MKTLDVYSRHGCHLCEVMLEELLPLVRGQFDVIVHDIDTREDWKRAYDTRVPVIEYDGELICQYHLDRQALAALLSSNETNT
jgi:Ni2+-binding GTPase involved in maturation of urease and hydrogenase